MIATTYTVVTPCGRFVAEWSDDADEPASYRGNNDALAYFKQFLALESVSGRGGALLSMASMGPADLYGFCQSDRYGIVVLPEFDDMFAMTTTDEEEAMMGQVFDAIDDSQTFALIGEGAQLLKRLNEDAATFFTDLGRLREIVQLLGEVAELQPSDANNAVVMKHNGAEAGVVMPARGTEEAPQADEVGPQDRLFADPWGEDLTFGLPAWEASAELIRSLTEAQFSAIHGTIEDGNHHAEALILRAKRIGTPAQVEQAESLRRERQAAGELTPALSEWSAALSAALGGMAQNEATVPVALSGKELGEFPDTPEGLKQLRKAGRGYLMAMRGEFVDCPILGCKVEIRKRGIEETMAFSANPKKLKLIPAIRSLISTATQSEQQENFKKAKKINVVSYHHLKNVAVLDGEKLSVEVIIEELTDGTLYYDFLVDRDDTKTALDSSNAVPVSPCSPDHNPGHWLEISMADPTGDIKPFDVTAVLDDAGGAPVLNLFIEGEDTAAPTALDYDARADEVVAAITAEERQMIGMGILPHVLMEALDRQGYTDERKLTIALMEAAQRFKDAMTANPMAAAKERIQSSEFKALTRDFMRSLAVIRGLDEGTEKGWDRALFVSSIVGKIKTRAKNDPMLAALLLAWLFESQKDWKKPAVTLKNGIWNAVAGWEPYRQLFREEAPPPEAADPAPLATPAPIAEPQPGIEPTPTESQAVHSAQAGDPVAPESAQPPEGDPMPQPDPQREADIATLQAVIDGTADLMAPDLADQLATIHDRHQDHAEIMALFDRAAQAYSNFMVEQARVALA